MSKRYVPSFGGMVEYRDEDETRVTDPNTGGQKGQKLARFDLIPVGPLTTLAEHYGTGAKKYAERNWEKGYVWSLTYGALMRHVTAWWNGEDIDPDNGMPHMAAVAFHAFAAMEFGETHPELDDRPATSDPLGAVAAASYQSGYEAGWADGYKDPGPQADNARQERPQCFCPQPSDDRPHGGNGADGPDYGPTVIEEGEPTHPFDERPA